jgi:hypothetical protein
MVPRHRVRPEYAGNCNRQAEPLVSGLRGGSRPGDLGWVLAAGRCSVPAAVAAADPAEVPDRRQPVDRPAPRRGVAGRGDRGRPVPQLGVAGAAAPVPGHGHRLVGLPGSLTWSPEPAPRTSPGRCSSPSTPSRTTSNRSSPRPLPATGASCSPAPWAPDRWLNLTPAGVRE